MKKIVCLIVIFALVAFSSVVCLAASRVVPDYVQKVIRGYITIEQAKLADPPLNVAFLWAVKSDSLVQWYLDKEDATIVIDLEDGYIRYNRNAIYVELFNRSCVKTICEYADGPHFWDGRVSWEQPNNEYVTPSEVASSNCEKMLINFLDSHRQSEFWCQFMMLKRDFVFRRCR